MASAPTTDHTRVGSAAPGDPDARAIVASWRKLTGGKRVRDAGRRTLVACSGGADSSALAIVLASADPRTVLGHVVHDLRPREDALADRERVRELARTLGVGFECAEVDVTGRGGNAEGEARRARYEALGRMAGAHAIKFIATAHHADDQLETVLMRVFRGAGPAGLRGVRAGRTEGEARVIRPMLVVDRAACERICVEAGWVWREDATNRDTDRVRNAIRASVTPRVREIAPDAPARAVRGAALFEDVFGLVEDAAVGVLASGRVGEGRWAWARRDLAAQRGVVLGAVFMSIAAGEDEGGDGVSTRTLDRLVDAIREDSGGSRVFELGRCCVVVTGTRVEAEAKGQA